VATLLLIVLAVPGLAGAAFLVGLLLARLELAGLSSHGGEYQLDLALGVVAFSALVGFLIYLMIYLEV
jgi:hypothetical protein